MTAGLKTREVGTEDACIGGVDQPQPDALALSDRKGIRHAAIDGNRVADAAIVVNVVPVAEILADCARFRQPSVTEHPGHLAIGPHRLRFLDDQRTIKSAPDLFEAPLVRVIPADADVDGVELVDEALARSNRLLREVRHAIHGMWHTHAMPVHGRFLGKAVLYLDPHALALTDPDFRAWNGPSARNRARFTRPNGVHFGGACTADPLDLIRERMGAAIGIAMKAYRTVELRAQTFGGRLAFKRYRATLTVLRLGGCRGRIPGSASAPRTPAVDPVPQSREARCSLQTMSWILTPLFQHFARLPDSAAVSLHRQFYWRSDVPIGSGEAS